MASFADAQYLIISLHMDLIIKCEEPRPANHLSEETAFPRRIYPLFFFEDVYRFPGSGPVMDSNAAKEIIHSCPITTYEAPINTRSPGLGGRPGSCWEQGGPGELPLSVFCLGGVGTEMDRLWIYFWILPSVWWCGAHPSNTYLKDLCYGNSGFTLLILDILINCGQSNQIWFVWTILASHPLSRIYRLQLHALLMVNKSF